MLSGRSLPPLTSELMIALVGGGDVMLSLPHAPASQDSCSWLLRVYPSRLKVVPIPQVFMEVVCPV